MSPLGKAVFFQDGDAGEVDVEEDGIEVVEPQAWRLLQGMADESLADSPAQRVMFHIITDFSNVLQGLSSPSMGTEAAPAGDPLLFLHNKDGVLVRSVLGKPFPSLIHYEWFNVCRAVPLFHCLIVDGNNLFQVVWRGITYLHG